MENSEVEKDNTRKTKEELIDKMEKEMKLLSDENLNIFLAYLKELYEEHNIEKQLKYNIKISTNDEHSDINSVN